MSDGSKNADRSRLVIGITGASGVAYGLRALDASRLFESNTVHLGFRRNNHLRRFALDIIELLVPQLNRKTVLAAIEAAAPA